PAVWDRRCRVRARPRAAAAGCRFSPERRAPHGWRGAEGGRRPAKRGVPPGQGAVFPPNAAQRTGGAALKAAADLSKALTRQLETLAREEPSKAATGKSGCAPPWAHFCDFVYSAVEYSTEHGKGVV